MHSVQGTFLPSLRHSLVVLASRLAASSPAPVRHIFPSRFATMILQEIIVNVGGDGVFVLDPVRKPGGYHIESTRRPDKRMDVRFGKFR